MPLSMLDTVVLALRLDGPRKGWSTSSAPVLPALGPRFADAGALVEAS